MRLDKIWNKKNRGLIPSVFLGFSILCRKMKDIISTFCFQNNIATHGKNLRINSGIVYRYPGKIHLGDNIVIGANVELSTEHLPESILILKNGVTVGDGCSIDFTGGITICEGTHLAHKVRIISHDHGYNHKNEPVGKPLIIGRNVFVGSDVIILFNCNNIGENAVIGTGSVVTKDVPDNAIVVGNPAKIIKYRDDL